MNDLFVLLGIVFVSSTIGWLCLRLMGLRAHLDVFVSFLWVVFMPLCLTASLYALLH